MDAAHYCEMVERKHRVQQQLAPAMPVREDGSPLVSLLESGFDLIFEPSISPDYRYLVREAAVEKIGRISKRLGKADKALIIRSAWRSFEHQQLLWDRNYEVARKANPDKPLEELDEIVLQFTASRENSMHATGGAVDALIYDPIKDRVMDFGTNDGYKLTLNEKCYPLHPDISPEAKRSRKLLMNLFEAEGFVCGLTEYWHFDYGNAVWAVEQGKEYASYGVNGDG